jgi:hypothetical protein
MLNEVGPNVGFRLDGVYAHRGSEEFEAKQEQAWALVRDALDRGFPCYAWDLSVPEYYVVNGYDDTGYYFSGCDCPDGAGPFPWRELGTRDTGFLEAYRLETCSPAPDATVVKDALRLAGEMAEGRALCTSDAYVSGPEAFRAWAEALERGDAQPFGHAYNAAVWNECRGDAVAFLKEAKAKLPGPADAAFDDAIAYYTRVHEHLQALTDLFPFPPREGAPDPERDRQGAIHLRAAAEAERQGLEALGRVSRVL